MTCLGSGAACEVPVGVAIECLQALCIAYLNSGS